MNTHFLHILKQSKKIREYKTISLEEKQKLLNLVFKLQWKIVKAAAHININYPAAKTIITKYRKEVLQQKLKISNSQGPCNYRLIKQNENVNIKIQSKLCGKNNKK